MEGRKYTEINTRTSARPGSHHKPGQQWWDWGATTGTFRPLQSCSVRAAINWKRCETARISAGKWGHCGGQLMCRLNRFANLQPACSQLKLPDGTRPRSWYPQLCPDVRRQQPDQLLYEIISSVPTFITDLVETQTVGLSSFLPGELSELYQPMTIFQPSTG